MSYQPCYRRVAYACERHASFLGAAAASIQALVGRELRSMRALVRVVSLTDQSVDCSGECLMISFSHTGPANGAAMGAPADSVCKAPHTFFGPL